MAAAAAKASSAASTTTASASPFRLLVDADEAWSFRIHDSCRAVPRPLLKALEISGDGWFWFPVPLALLAVSPSPPLTSALLALLAGCFLDLLLVGLVKHLVRRRRPVYNKGMRVTFGPDHWSFPSGHSSRVFFIATFLWLTSELLREAAIASGGSALWRRWAGVFDRFGFEMEELFLALVFTWSAATSVSRVLLGRHFICDVVAGACFGVFEALIVSTFYYWM